MIMNGHCLFLWISELKIGRSFVVELAFSGIFVVVVLLLLFYYVGFLKKEAQILEEKPQMPYSFWWLRRNDWLRVTDERFSSFLASGNSAKYRQIQFCDLSAWGEQAFASAVSCMSLLLWQFFFFLPCLSLWRSVMTARDALFYLGCLCPSNCCELIILENWVWGFFFVWVTFCNLCE